MKEVKKERKKRLKRVFSSGDQVLHLWANQSQSDARSRNVFFEGDTCYSYGYHYPLGKIADFKGQKIAFINEAGYSFTTSNHIHQAKGAASHLLVLGVESSKDFGDFEKALLRKQDFLINKLMGTLSRRVFWDAEYTRGNWIQRDILRFNETCILLGCSHLIVDLGSELFEVLKDHVRFRIERQKELDAGAAERRAKKQAANLIKLKDAIEVWKSGGLKGAGISALSPQLIRVKGSEIETSQGALVPLKEATALLHKIMDGTAKTGDSIGSFTFNSFKDGIVKIGCHTFRIEDAKILLERKLKVVS